MRGLTRASCLTLAFLTSAVVIAAPPAGIRLPEPAAAPVQPAFPGAVPRLTADLLYVIDSDVPCIVLASPEGVVSLAEDAGPVKVRGRFVGGGGKVETRTFKGKQVIVVEAVASGRVELLIVPAGATKAADVVRQTLDVDAGAAIPPPPKLPPPAPPPVEPPKPVDPVAYYFLVVRADGPASPAFTAAMGLPAWATLKTRGHQVKDKTLTEAAGLNLALPPGTVLPVVVTLDTAGGKSKIVREPIPLPTTDAGVLALPEGVRK